MPRQPRTPSGTGVYHVMLRGINRQDIFLDNEDYVRMQSCMQQMLEQYDEAGNHLLPLCTMCHGRQVTDIKNVQVPTAKDTCHASRDNHQVLVSIT